jgi:hypothetical protein
VAFRPRLELETVLGLADAMREGMNVPEVVFVERVTSVIAVYSREDGVQTHKCVCTMVCLYTFYGVLVHCVQTHSQ